MKIFFILGANDPEMQMIETLLPEGSFAHAIVAGKRAMAHQAMTADGTSVSVPEGVKVYCVECRIAGLDAVLIDHHGESPEAAFGPDRFWEASSIGRVFEILCPGQTPTPQLLMEAALDHCKWAAARGECPNVPGETFVSFAARRYAEFNGWDPEIFGAQVQSARCAIEEAKRVSWLTGNVANLSEMPLPAADPNGPFIQGLHYATHIACLYNGRAVLVSARGKDGRHGLQLNGAGAGTPAGEEPVRAFLDYFKQTGYEAPNLYGDPARGYAGMWFAPTCLFFQDLESAIAAWNGQGTVYLMGVADTYARNRGPGYLAVVEEVYALDQLENTGLSDSHRDTFVWGGILYTSAEQRIEPDALPGSIPSRDSWGVWVRGDVDHEVQRGFLWAAGRLLRLFSEVRSFVTEEIAADLAVLYHNEIQKTRIERFATVTLVTGAYLLFADLPEPVRQDKVFQMTLLLAEYFRRKC